jgi:hypothetical protein
LRVAEERFGVRKQVMAGRHRLRALEVRVARHHPSRMRPGFGGEGVDRLRDRRHEHRSGGAAVKPQVQRDLVVARAAGVQRGARGRELGQPALDCSVDVFV